MPSSEVSFRLVRTTLLGNQPRRILFIAALIVVPAALLWVALPSRPVAIAADGRWVAVEKVTFGTRHSFTRGKRWVRLLTPIKGKTWAALRGCYETHITNDVPALVVWTRWENLQRSSVGVVASILDERGTESDLVLNRWNDVPRSPGSNPEPAYVAWMFDNFPRRARKLRLRIYDQRSRPTQIVELALSNPVRNRSPGWRGSDLPVQVATNSTAYILNSVQQASNALWRFSFVVQTNNQPDFSWSAGGITVSNASGNVFGARSNLAATVVTNLAFQLRGALWPDEPVWRFTTEFFRTVNFQPNELWTLTNIAIPSRGAPFRFVTNLISHGNHSADVNLESIPLTAPSPYRPRGIWRNANVSVRFEAPDQHLFLVEATDDQGRRIHSEVDLGAPRMSYVFGLLIPTNAQSMNLTFAICRPTVVTFDVAGRSFARKGPR